MPRLLCSLIISILPLSISGCADFQDRPLNPITSATHIDARTLSNPDLHKFITRIIGHKTTWDLDSLTLAAIYYHADVAVAQALADNTDAAITTAGQRPNPSISLSPTWISNLATTAMPWIFTLCYSF